MPKLGGHFTKKLKFRKKCRFCKHFFKAADVKARICSDCVVRKHPCACGCGGVVVGMHKKYLFAHAVRDKNNVRMAQGHKVQSRKMLGKNNPSSRLSVQKKLSKAVKASWRRPEVRLNHLLGQAPNKWIPTRNKFPYGRSVFKSCLELAFAKWCRRNHIHYRYEFKRFYIPQISSTYCPDFYLVDHKFFIEIKGGPWVGKNMEGLWKPRALAKFLGVEIYVLLGKHLKELGAL